MIGKFFHRKHTLTSLLNEEEIFRRLEELLAQGKHSVGEEQRGFTGSLRMQKHSFSLRPNFDYNLRDQIRPQIDGIVNQRNKDVIIELNISLPIETVVLIDFALLFNLALVAVSFLVDLPDRLPMEVLYIGWPAAWLIFILMCRFTFMNKTVESLRIIRDALEAN